MLSAGIAIIKVACMLGAGIAPEGIALKSKVSLSEWRCTYFDKHCAAAAVAHEVAELDGVGRRQSAVCCTENGYLQVT